MNKLDGYNFIVSNAGDNERLFDWFEKIGLIWGSCIGSTPTFSTPMRVPSDIIYDVIYMVKDGGVTYADSSGGSTCQEWADYSGYVDNVIVFSDVEDLDALLNGILMDLL